MATSNVSNRVASSPARRRYSSPVLPDTTPTFARARPEASVTTGCRLATVSVEVTTPALTVMSTNPTAIHTMAMMRPGCVTGTRSPYPTVLSVTTLHQKLSRMPWPAGPSMGGLRRRSAAQNSTPNTSANRIRIPIHEATSMRAIRSITERKERLLWTRVAIEMPLWSKGGVIVKRTRFSGTMARPATTTSTLPPASASVASSSGSRTTS